MIPTVFMISKTTITFLQLTNQKTTILLNDSSIIILNIRILSSFPSVHEGTTLFGIPFFFIYKYSEHSKDHPFFKSNLTFYSILSHSYSSPFSLFIFHNFSPITTTSLHSILLHSNPSHSHQFHLFFSFYLFHNYLHFLPIFTSNQYLLLISIRSSIQIPLSS